MSLRRPTPLPPPEETPAPSPAASAPPAAPAPRRAASGRPPPRLTDDLSPGRRKQIWLAAGALACLVVGALLGLELSPESPRELKQQLAAAQKAAQTNQERVAQLEQMMHEADTNQGRGKLRPADKARHEREGRRYAATLRKVGAQGAGDLMEWFVSRWNQILDSPMPDDRIGRRAAALSLLVGGMASNLNPGDFVPWQAEFLIDSNWLGELHFDIDGDGLPGHRTSKNTHDGFANVSICQVAMALNQSMLDGRVLVMPEMHCDRPEARMSVFLQGATFDDALNEFVKSVREQGFLVVEKHQKNIRLILVGPRPPPPKEY